MEKWTVRIPGLFLPDGGVPVDIAVAKKYLCSGLWGLILRTPFTGLPIDIESEVMEGALQTNG